jgi:hypothetical protein
MSAGKIDGSGYEIMQQIEIGDREILLAENPKASDGLFYMVCDYRENGITGEYSGALAGDDYLEALLEFTGRINEEAERLRAVRDELNLPRKLFTAEHCYPHDGRDIKGEVVVINAGMLRPEYRRGDAQLVMVTGGSGARSDSRGTAVYGYNLNDGKHGEYRRSYILGIIKELPDWAKDRLAAIKAERRAERTPKPETNAKDRDGTPGVMDKLAAAKAEAGRISAERNPQKRETDNHNREVTLWTEH